jgi:hypothetical protein
MTAPPDLTLINNAAPDAKDNTSTINGHQVLDAVSAAVARHVITPSPEALTAIVLWTAATHAQLAWNNATRLAINSPEKRCGKSRLLEILHGLCHDPLMTANITTAALFRTIQLSDVPPTILLDEADTIFGTKVKAEQNEDLRGLINAGYSRHLPSIRCVGPLQVPTKFENYAMLAAAGIGQLPDTITDRAVNITMRRRSAGETVQPYRANRDRPALHVLRDKLAGWLATHVPDLADTDPDMPLEDRAADNWAPLVAVADLAGGDWPLTARIAAKVLNDEHEQHDATASLNMELLRDLQAIWSDTPGDFIGSKVLATQLRQDENLPWGEMELSPRRLAGRLCKFGITPSRNTMQTERGYRRADFTDSFTRYIVTGPAS